MLDALTWLPFINVMATKFVVAMDANPRNAPFPVTANAKRTKKPSSLALRLVSYDHYIHGAPDYVPFSTMEMAEIEEKK